MHAEAEARADGLAAGLRRAEKPRPKLDGEITAMTWGGSSAAMPGRICYVLFVRIVNTGIAPSAALDYRAKILSEGGFIPFEVHYLDAATFIMTGASAAAGAQGKDASTG